MNSTFYEKILAKILGAAERVNFCAQEKDVNRNHVNYGCVSATADIIRELGHEIDVAVWEDDGVLKIPQITIDGNTTEFAGGQ